jgi:hypothetical protein
MITPTSNRPSGWELYWESAPARTDATRTALEAITGMPPDALLTFLCIDWFNGVEQFRTAEAINLSNEGSFEALLDFHRATIARLIYQGEGLVLLFQGRALVEGAKFTANDIRATIDSLRETFRGVNGPHNHPETNKKILAILEAA